MKYRIHEKSIKGITYFAVACRYLFFIPWIEVYFFEGIDKGVGWPGKWFRQVTMDFLTKKEAVDSIKYHKIDYQYREYRIQAAINKESWCYFTEDIITNNGSQEGYEYSLTIDELEDKIDKYILEQENRIVKIHKL